ncbi:transmembrane protein [Cystoisospora suis]|uniref:Transmembrane protein n=1 Tax=Cystoisospora suis TaxID=483139 RepID=A0A2C6KRU9_9APIC|nr:transmembrane protein [Cystoisospora suis]
MSRRHRGPRSACSRVLPSPPSSGRVAVACTDTSSFATTDNHRSSVACDADACVTGHTPPKAIGVGDTARQMSLQPEHTAHGSNGSGEGARFEESGVREPPSSNNCCARTPGGQMLSTPEESAADVVSTAASSFTSLPPLSPAQQTRAKIGRERLEFGSCGTDVPVTDVTAEGKRRRDTLRHRKQVTPRENNFFQQDATGEDRTSDSQETVVGWFTRDKRREGLSRTEKGSLFLYLLVARGIQQTVHFFYRLGAHPLLGWGLLCFLVIQEHQLQSMYHRGCVELDALNATCGHTRRLGAATERHFVPQSQAFSPRKALAARERNQPALYHETAPATWGILGDARTQCTCMMILGMAGGVFVLLAILCHTVVALCSVCLRMKCVVGRQESNHRHESDQDVNSSVHGDNIRDLRSKSPTSEGSKREGPYPALCGDQETSDDSWRYRLNSSAEGSHSHDQATQTDDLPQVLGSGVESGSRCVQGSPVHVIGKALSSYSSTPKDGDNNSGVCTPLVDREQFGTSHEPETFYIGDDDGDSLVALTGCPSDEVVCFSKGGSVSSLVW